MRTELSFEVAPISDARIVWNREELSAMVDTIVAQYKGLAYTADQITDAKKDRANLNKALTAIETERKRVKAEYLGPYTAFEDEVKEISSKIKGAIDEIDAQTRAYEAEQKAIKRSALEEYFVSEVGSLSEIVRFEDVFEDRMLNATAPLAKSQAQISERLSKITSDLNTIDGLQSDFKTEIKAYYLKTFDLGGALSESRRLYEIREAERKRAEEEARRKDAATSIYAPTAPSGADEPASTPVGQNEAPEAPECFEMTFVVSGTMEQLRKIKRFLDAEGISYK